MAMARARVRDWAVFRRRVFGRHSVRARGGNAGTLRQRGRGVRAVGQGCTRGRAPRARRARAAPGWGALQAVGYVAAGLRAVGRTSGARAHTRKRTHAHARLG